LDIRDLIPFYAEEDWKSKKRLRVDFVNFEEFRDESRSYPIGLLSVSSFLKKKGFVNVGLVDYVCTLRKEAEASKPNPGVLRPNLDWLVQERTRSSDEMLGFLKKRKPHILLLGPITTFYLIELVNLLPTLRKEFPDCLILAGGPHFGKDTNLDKELLENYKGLDGIIIGEAEETVAEIAEKFYAYFMLGHKKVDPAKFKDRLSKIAGIRVERQELIVRKPPNLATIPMPDMELLKEHLGDPQNYFNNPKYRLSERRNPVVWVDCGVVDDAYGGGNTIDDIHFFEYTFAGRDSRFPFGVIVGSRGCPFHCAFCCTSTDRRVFSAERIFMELQYLSGSYGVRLFVFFDALFVDSSPADQKRIEDLCRMIIMSNIDIRFMVELRADVICKLSDKLLRMMITAGCVEFNLGLEKGTERMLQEMNKKLSVDDHKKAITKIRRIADELMTMVIVNGTFILGGPGENKKDIRDTLIHCFSLHLDQATLYPMEIYPGTEVGEKALAEEIIKPGLEPYLDPKTYPLYETKVLTKEYLFEIKNSAEHVLRSINSFKEDVQSIERQFLPEGVRSDIVNFAIYETKELQKRVEDYIEVFLDFIKNPEYFNQMKVELAVKSVENEIQNIEDRFSNKYPDYDYQCGNYYQGSLLNGWQNLKNSFENLFILNDFKE
jgi:radical SAM superfamily enzyme YgiQ (UPF0313 family)